MECSGRECRMVWIVGFVRYRFVAFDDGCEFIIGVKIYLPFLVIDVVVANILLGMGMMVLPPVVLSLPLKILLFVLMDGWSLLISVMAAGFYGI